MWRQTVRSLRSSASRTRSSGGKSSGSLFATALPGSEQRTMAMKPENIHPRRDRSLLAERMLGTRGAQGGRSCPRFAAADGRAAFKPCLVGCLRLACGARAPGHDENPLFISEGESAATERSQLGTSRAKAIVLISSSSPDNRDIFHAHVVQPEVVRRRRRSVPEPPKTGVVEPTVRLSNDRSLWVGGQGNFLMARHFAWKRAHREHATVTSFPPPGRASRTDVTRATPL